MNDSFQRQKFAAVGRRHPLFKRRRVLAKSAATRIDLPSFFYGGVYEEFEEWLRFHSAGGDRRNPDAARLWACSGLHSERDRNGSKRRCHTGRDGYGHAYGIGQQI